MAGLGRKTFAQEEVLRAADVNGYLMDQSVMRFANSGARGSAIGTAVAEGMVSYLDDANSVEVYDGSAWKSVGQDLTLGTSGFTALSAGTAGISYQPVSHNYIINGAFDVNQREFASTTSSNVYTFDRWQTFATDGTVTYTAESFSPGELETPSLEGKSFIRVDVTGQTATNAAAQLHQFVEGVENLAGQTATFSFYAKAATGTPKVAIEFRQYFGTGGSALENIFGGQVTLSTTWQKYSVTVAVPSIAGKTVLATGQNALRVGWWFSGGSNSDARHGSLGIQTNTFDIWGVQLEAGSVATPFKRHAPSLQGELAACQRYYEKSYSPGFAPAAAVTAGAVVSSGNAAAATTGFIGCGATFKVLKRAAPTVVIYDAAGNVGKVGRFNFGSAATNNQNGGTFFISENGFNVESNTGTSNQAIIFHYTADSEL